MQVTQNISSKSDSGSISQVKPLDHSGRHGLDRGTGGIAWLILWMMTLIRPFKGGDTVWGVLTIFFSPIVPIIRGFMKGHTKLAILRIVVAFIFGAGYGMRGASLVSERQNTQP